MNRSTQTFCLVALGAMMLSASSAQQTIIAQKAEDRVAAAVAQIEQECGSDVKSYCATVTPGEGRLIFCMLAHEDKISTKCDYALYAARRNAGRALDRVEQIADACWPDVDKHCSSIPEGGGRVAQCLLDKNASLEKDCQAELAKLSASK